MKINKILLIALFAIIIMEALCNFMFFRNDSKVQNENKKSFSIKIKI